MSTFGGRPQDVIVDPADHGPVAGAQVTIYASNPKDGAANPVRDILDRDGNPLPGVAVADDAGLIWFKTVSDYDVLYGQDAATNVYRYDSWESVDNINVWADQFPDVKQQAADAETVAGEANATAADAKDVAQQALDEINDIAVPKSLPLNEVTPVYVGEMQVALTRVIQCAAKDLVTGDWFVAQNDGASPENTVISHLTPQGAFINAVQLTAGGHGMTCYPQWIDGELWVWSGWNDGTTNEIVRFKWRGDQYTTTVIDKTAADIEVMNTFGTDSVLAQIDEQQDRLMYRHSGGQYDVRRLSDVEAGTNDLLYSSTIPTPAGATFQGWCFLDDTVYVYTGSGTSFTPPDPCTIYVYDLPTASQLYQVDIEGIGMEGSGRYLDQMYEPESVTLYRNGAGKPTIFMGMCVGGGNDRHIKIYAWTQGDTAAPGGFAADALVGAMESEPNFHTHPVPTTINKVAVTKIAQITRPGWYYFDSATFATFTDRPAAATLTGHFLHVSAWSAAYAMPHSVQIQKLYTNHTTPNMDSWVRVNDSARTPDFWTHLSNTHETAFGA